MTDATTKILNAVTAAGLADAATIAARLGVSRPAVARHLPRLVQMGHLTAHKTTLRGGGYRWLYAVPAGGCNNNHVTTVGPVSIYNADARTLARHVTEPVALVVTSPPYNVGIGYNTHDDAMPEADYRALLADAWRACYAVMACGARLAAVVPHTVGAAPGVPLADVVRALLVEASFVPAEEVTWDKGRAVVGNSTAYGSHLQPTSPAIRDRTERIVIVKKPGRFVVPDGALAWSERYGKRVSPWLLGKGVWEELTQDVWCIPPESARRVGHPAPFPVALAERVLRLYGYPGCHVLDPFAGSGTVGVAAIRLGARATLFDVDADYCRLAARRCEATMPTLIQLPERVYA